jgi:integrase
MSELLLDAAGRRRSPATLPEFHAGRPPRNKGMRYPADPPTVEEIVTVMRSAGDGIHGRRLRGLIVVLWRAGLRIHEALALAEADLDARRGSLLVPRQGRPAPRGRHGRLGLGTARALARRARRAAGRAGVLRRQRRHARTPLGGRHRPHRATTRRPRGRRTATLLRRTNCVTRTRSRWPARACR